MTFISDAERTKFHVRDSTREMHLILKLQVHGRDDFMRHKHSAGLKTTTNETL